MSRDRYKGFLDKIYKISEKGYVYAILKDDNFVDIVIDRTIPKEIISNYIELIHLKELNEIIEKYYFASLHIDAYSAMLDNLISTVSFSLTFSSSKSDDNIYYKLCFKNRENFLHRIRTSHFCEVGQEEVEDEIIKVRKKIYEIRKSS